MLSTIFTITRQCREAEKLSRVALSRIRVKHKREKIKTAKCYCYKSFYFLNYKVTFLLVRNKKKSLLIWGRLLYVCFLSSRFLTIYDDDYCTDVTIDMIYINTGVPGQIVQQSTDLSIITLKNVALQ